MASATLQVQASPAERREVVEQHLTDEGVAEAELGRVLGRLDQQAVDHRRVEVVDDVGHARGRRRRPGCRGRRRARPPRRSRAGRWSASGSWARRRRMTSPTPPGTSPAPLPLLVEEAGQLDGVERVALGPLVDGGGGAGVEIACGRPCSSISVVASAVRPRSRSRRLPASAGDRRQGVGDRVVAPDLELAHGGDHEQAPIQRGAAGQEGEQLERGGVGPLEVVEQDHDRLPGRHPARRRSATASKRSNWVAAAWPVPIGVDPVEQLVERGRDLVGRPRRSSAAAAATATARAPRRPRRCVPTRRASPVCSA